MICSYCNEELKEPLKHLMSECPSAPEEAKQLAKKVYDGRLAYAKQDACCKLRKKILLRPVNLPEEICGIPDSEVADVLTFEKVEGVDVIQMRFCPWCGKPWKVTGLNVL